MPWKNGGGETTEIASRPPGAALDAFMWRVSIARVDRDGPFSRFPGIDRTIVLLEGTGMRLTGDTRNALLQVPFEPYAFAGEDGIECTLVAGPVRDFNAMFRRGSASGSVAVIRNGGAKVPPAAFRLAYAARGAHACEIPGHPQVMLAAGHMLLIERTADAGAVPMTIRPLAADAIALAVSVECA